MGGIPTAVRWGIGTLALLLIGAPAVAAQAPGIPVVNYGVAKGLTLAGMVGFPNRAAGGGTGYSVAGALGFRRLAIGGFVSSQDGSQFPERVYAGGGTITLKVAGGPLVPISINLQGGVSYSKPIDGVEAWHVPVGLGISWTIPRPVVALKPWIAPRLDYRRQSAGPMLSTYDSSDFGLSGGINFGFLNGFGIDVAFDRVFSDVAPKPTTVGVGVSFTIK